MAPCNSGNSPTTSVVRSALARTAARRASAVISPLEGRWPKAEVGVWRGSATPLAPSATISPQGGDCARHDRRQFLSKPRDALHPLTLRAELGVEGDAEMVEAGHALVERLLEIEPELFRRCLQLVEIRQIVLVGLPEIERVGEAGAHHLAVAVGDLLAAVAWPRCWRSGRSGWKAPHRAPAAGVHKTLLVGADGQPDHLGRNGEKVLLELAHQHDRPFDQA